MNILRAHQQEMQTILDEVVRICDNNNINYWLSSGTLLGAIRHKGFIPWDDDLDIEVTDKDFKKLIKLLKNELPAHLKLQTNKTDWFYPGVYAKVRDVNSRIFEVNNVDKNYKYKGIYIDIFRIKKSSKMLVYISMRVHNFFAYRMRSFLTKNSQFPLKAVLMRGVMLMLSVVYNFFGLIDWFIKPNKYYHYYGACFMNPRDIEDIFPVGKVLFEGKEYNCPKDSHAYLTKMFGDYMKLPKESERKPHISKIELNGK